MSHLTTSEYISKIYHRLNNKLFSSLWIYTQSKDIHILHLKLLIVTSWHSHGMITSGKPIFLATIVFPTMRWGYASLTCFRSPSSNRTDTHIPADIQTHMCIIHNYSLAHCVEARSSPWSRSMWTRYIFRIVSGVVLYDNICLGITILVQLLLQSL